MFYLQLRQANITRCATAFPQCIDWTNTDWACALAGEVGEVCNAVKKKHKRGDGDIDSIVDELADVIIYADLLLAVLDKDLMVTVVKKFNEVSDRIGSNIKL